MPIYLAYQINLRQISDSKLVKIMDDYFDFSINKAQDASHRIERWNNF